ncbi:NAD(P)-dependent oxidoreductase [Arthrobacter sp. JZ12]|uniref:NAD(P)-dependent oxidoreductase n=1 Tax=Arthrobacter sp. JZ12 TaxID=2654190 RepID=UPI003A5D169B
MTSIGFIGLGIMGRPMAANLVKAGHSVSAFSRSQESRNAASALGIPVVESVRAAVETADVVISMLPDSPDVEAVALGDEGILASLGPGAGYIDMSTISPAVARRIAAAFRDQGYSVLDAPVSGGEAGAKEGSLSIMVGGDQGDFERWHKELGAMGTTVVHVGESGAGQTVKAANQLVVAGHLQMLAEAVVFLEAQQADVGLALSVIARGLGGSTVIDRKTAGVLEDDYRPGFRAELHHKDLNIVNDAARTAGLSLPVTSLVSGLVQSIVERGDGGLDHSILVSSARNANAAVNA